jgi:hypothetical protein
MYTSTTEDFHGSIDEILAAKSHNIVSFDHDQCHPTKVVAKICSSCRSGRRSSVFNRLLHMSECLAVDSRN